MKEIIAKYFKFRSQIDALAEELELIHRPNMVCRNGCDACCMAISVFPIEFYAIQSEVDNYLKNIRLSKAKDTNECALLNKHSCTIYKSRPIICRTHGLPLLYMNDEGTEWELSHCELNFADYDFDEFTHENTYPQDTLNSKLFVLNREFIANFSEKKYAETDRIPLSNLI